jgi:hypothetical protein
MPETYILGGDPKDPDYHAPKSKLEKVLAKYAPAEGVVVTRFTRDESCAIYKRISDKWVEIRKDTERRLRLSEEANARIFLTD